MDKEHGLNQYDYAARFMDPSMIRFTTVDPKAEKYYNLSPYAYVGNNPLRFTDPTGMFLFEKRGMENNTSYGVVIVMSTRYEQTGILRHDYSVAEKEGIPVLLVDNIDDMANGMSDMEANGITTKSYSINSHGSEGYAQIGQLSTTKENDFSPLKAGLEGKNVFFNVCNMTRAGDKQGTEYIKNFATQTGSTVVSSDHAVLSGYKFDGSDYLSKPDRGLNGRKKSYSSYHIAFPGKEAKPIYDFSITKDGKFSWRATFDDEVEPK